MKNFAKRIVIRTSIFFTVLTFAYAFLVLALYGGLISSLRTVMFFVFSMVFALANEMLHSPSRRGLWIAIHAIITGAAFYLFMLLPAKYEDTANWSAGNTMMGMFIFYLIYGIVAATFLVCLSQAEKKKNREKEYHSVFGKR